MGKPKFPKKKYETPSHPWQEDRIKAENELLRKYGLKNKREIWKAQTSLRRYRGQARELLAKISGGNPQIKKESDQLISHLTRINILPLNSTLDDVLALETESILSRRLQTLTYLKGLSSTPHQARQLIAHGHISIGDRKITIPGFIVKKDEENEISYIDDSPLNDPLHPARPRGEFKSIPIKKEEQLEKTIEKTGKEEKKEEEKQPTKQTVDKEKKETETKPEKGKKPKKDEKTIEKKIKKQDPNSQKEKKPEKPQQKKKEGGN